MIDTAEYDLLVYTRSIQIIFYDFFIIIYLVLFVYLLIVMHVYMITHYY